MVIKTSKTIRLSVSYNYAEICQPCLEKLPKHKIYQLLAKISYNCYTGKYLKIWSPCIRILIPWQSLVMGFQSLNLDAVSQQLYQKNFHQGFFLCKFLRIDIKNNSRWIAHNILSKKPLGKFCRRYFNDILSEFCLNGVSLDK